jgi:hypothetical protein
MAIATIGALVLAVCRTGDFTEAVAVMLFYQIGELFQSCAVGRSRRNIGELMDIRPDCANIEGPDGIEQVDPDEVEIGTVILVQPGEKVPIDGIVEDGDMRPFLPNGLGLYSYARTLFDISLTNDDIESDYMPYIYGEAYPEFKQILVELSDVISMRYLSQLESKVLPL